MSKTLHLNVHRKWFDMIKSGEKKEEYRIMSVYWFKRLVTKDNKYKEFDTVTFSNGYAKDRDQVIVEFKHTSRSRGKEEWGAVPGNLYYVIHLGDLILKQ